MKEGGRERGRSASLYLLGMFGIIIMSSTLTVFIACRINCVFEFKSEILFHKYCFIVL